MNPPVLTTGAAIAVPASRRTGLDYVALAIATCGVGYLPLAPGTWGSVVGVGIYLIWQWVWGHFFQTFGDGHGIHYSFLFFWTTFTLLMAASLTWAGIWAATRVEKILGRKDPSIVVIDEVAGQFITFLFVSILHYAQFRWQVILAGFLLFRVFDIWKPYPVRRLEALESGLGIMADDVLAGIYAAMVLSLVTAIYLLMERGY